MVKLFEMVGVISVWCLPALQCAHERHYTHPSLVALCIAFSETLSGWINVPGNAVRGGRAIVAVSPRTLDDSSTITERSRERDMAILHAYRVEY